MAVIALLDANVLYPAGLRDLLMQLAVNGAFRARWTHQIHDEWIRNVIADRPDLEPERVRRVAMLMDSSLTDAHIAGYEALTDTLELPDPNDRHVLAAAITGGVGVIVTNNSKDFPASILEPHDIVAMTADAFVLGLLEEDSETVLEAVRTVQTRLRKPPVTMTEYLARLEQLGLPQTVAFISNRF